MTTLLLYGDTVRYPSVRHELPLEIVDPLLLVVIEGRPHVMTSSLEAERIRAELADVELLLLDELGFFELIAEGVPDDHAEHETVLRALERWDVGDAVVPPDLPIALADRLRDGGVAIEVDREAFSDRRRVKSAAQLAGIRRAQRAAEAGMAAGERLIRAAEPAGGRLELDGGTLTSERCGTQSGRPAPRRGRPRPRT